MSSAKFLSLIPTLHENAVIADKEASALDSTPQSPATKPIDQIEKMRRSSSSASAESMPGDMAGQVAKGQFLKLGQ